MVVLFRVILQCVYSYYKIIPNGLFDKKINVFLRTLKNVIIRRSFKTNRIRLLIKTWNAFCKNNNPIGVIVSRTTFLCAVRAYSVLIYLKRYHGHIIYMFPPRGIKIIIMQKTTQRTYFIYYYNIVEQGSCFFWRVYFAKKFERNVSW